MIVFVISAYLIGMLTFTLFAVFTNTAWENTYYIWDSLFGQGVLSWYLIYKLSNKRELVAPMIALSIFLFIWEFVSMFTGLYVNNSIAVASFFLLAIGATGYYLFHPKSPVVQFLIKNIP